MASNRLPAKKKDNHLSHLLIIGNYLTSLRCLCGATNSIAAYSKSNHRHKSLCGTNLIQALLLM